MINPVLTEMAVYPFTRLEEELRRLVAAGIDVIDFGKGDPNEPTDPLIRQALVDALQERAPYPLAQGLPELREAAAGWLDRRFGVALDPEREIVPTYGSKEAIFSLAQVLGTGGARRGVRRAGVPGVRARRAVRRGARANAAAAARERLSPRARRARRRRRAGLGQLPAQPDRRRRPPRVLRPARRSGRAPRLRGRLGRGVHGAVVRRATAVGAYRRTTAHASSSSRR